MLHGQGEFIMAIGNAVQRGPYVYVYDERGNHVAIINAGGDADNGLKGYTSTTVNVQIDGYIRSYNEKGEHISSTNPR